jgi:hypothetical protein
MRALLASLVLVILTGIAAVTWAQPSGQSACLVQSDDVDLADTQSILDALRIETRKESLLWTWRLVSEEPRCPADSPRVTLGKTSVVLQLMPAIKHAFALGGQSRERRAQMIARSVIEMLIAQQTTGEEAHVPLLDRDDDLALGGSTEVSTVEPPVEAVVAPVANPPLFNALIGGNLLHQFTGEGTAVEEGRLLAGPLLEISVSWFDERLAVALQGSAFWATTTRDTRLSVDAYGGDLLLMGRGGLRVGDVLLSVGGGLGFQHRVVTLDELSDRLEPSTSATSNVGLGSIDLGVAWRISHLVQLSGRLTGRLYFAAPEHQWMGQTLYGASSGALGGHIALGVTP